MRVKIIEGMALGKPIITTSIGSEGIKYTNGKNVLVANTSEEFVKAIESCLNDENYCNLLAKNARRLIEEEYDNHIICTKLAYFYHQLIK